WSSVWVRSTASPSSNRPEWVGSPHRRRGGVGELARSDGLQVVGEADCGEQSRGGRRERFEAASIPEGEQPLAGKKQKERGGAADQNAVRGDQTHGAIVGAARARTRAAISYQLSAISYQLSALSSAKT